MVEPLLALYLPHLRLKGLESTLRRELGSDPGLESPRDESSSNPQQSLLHVLAHG